jgi:hypothetical protein
MHLLAALADRIPSAVRERLAAIARSAVERPPAPVLWFEPGHGVAGVAAHLAVALGAYDAEETSERLLTLLAGAGDERVWAVGIAGRVVQPGHVGLLAGLCQAPESDLRANAAAAMASVAAAGNGGTLAASCLRSCLADPGTRVPYLIAKVLAGAPSLAPAARDALTALHDHPSALVRRTSRSTPGTA